MSKQDIPSWPTNLPPPIECGKRRKLICLSPDQLQKPEDLQDLVYELYWFPEDLHYIFGKDDKGMGAELFQQVEHVGISTYS
jgi:hypothetical protein